MSTNYLQQPIPNSIMEHTEGGSGTSIAGAFVDRNSSFARFGFRCNLQLKATLENKDMFWLSVI